MNKNDHKKFFLNQYALLEKEFVGTTQFVAFEEDNFKTHSNVFAKLLLQIGSETDNLMKSICELDGRTTINQYIDILCERYPLLTGQKVGVRDTQIKLVPFEGWEKDEPAKSLKFWYAYNLIKHDRIQNYKLATLENVSLGLAGLYVLNAYFSKDLYDVDEQEFSSELDYESELFIMDNWVNHFRPSKAKLEVPLMDDESGEIIN